ncbi:Uncharacterised protein [Mycobacteroides abscessus subsp. abscessus]|uniref:hypothetical protein n=1 Tax=Mycobacteroides abscessus TaxID=36809 RepID=UPI000929DF0D|nr:hypothetical protein [Mycobacteroides abscessus]SHY52200.1 Uncharacterised protein [Mycobacteroides abscessus subsp. abscessus]SIH54030.1 Uncharacterised protein [Mycobacteroides abscessus subsp. abscessus]SIK79672.1 Uncharacterised protein [Mycobacteroides abscessus subsp. abscessus]
MTLPAVREPVDVARLIKDWLKADMAARFPELSVRLELPADWVLGSDPVLLVADDGNDGTLDMWPAATAPIIRVTSWTSGRETKYAYAAMPRLLTTRIPGLAAILPGTAFLEARDSKTGGDLISFTVRTRARTR